MEVSRSLYRLARFLYPWLNNIREDWSELVQFLKGYKPIIVPKILYWRLPGEGWFKCNIDGAFKDNSRPSATYFCIRSWREDFVYAVSHELGVSSSIEAEI